MHAEMFEKSLLMFVIDCEMLKHEKDRCMDRGTDGWIDI